jgi:methylthioribose-1-phosphate isomerase
MSNELVTQNDLTQALSRMLMDVAVGRNIDKSKLEKQIDIADAINRRMQIKINTMKVMIEARKHGIDFAASMKEIGTLLQDTECGMGEMNSD